MTSLILIAVLITMLVVIPALIASNKTVPSENVDVNYLSMFNQITDYQICGESGIKEVVNVSNENECAEKCDADSTCDTFNYYPDRFVDDDKPNGCGINIEEGGCDISNRYIVSENTLGNKPAFPTPMQQLGNRVSYLRKTKYGDLTEPGGFTGGETVDCDVNATGTGYFMADKQNNGKCHIPYIQNPQLLSGMLSLSGDSFLPGKINMLSDTDKTNAMAVERWVPFTAFDGTLAFTIGPGADTADPTIMIKYQMRGGSIEKFALLINMHENDPPGALDSRFKPHAYMLLSPRIIALNQSSMAGENAPASLNQLIATNFPNNTQFNNDNVKIFEYQNNNNM